MHTFKRKVMWKQMMWLRAKLILQSFLGNARQCYAETNCCEGHDATKWDRRKGNI